MEPALAFVELECWCVWFVAGNDDPSSACRARKPLLFTLECSQWIQVISHNPGVRDVRDGWNQVRNEENSLVAASNFHTLHVADVACNDDNFHAGNNFGSAAQQIPLAGDFHGNKILNEIAGSVAVGGQLVDLPIVLRALRMLELERQMVGS